MIASPSLFVVLELIRFSPFCSNVVFRTHRLYLEANSPIFKDMFALGSNEKELPEVQPDESTAALEVALPYIPKAGRAVCAELY